MFQYVSILIGVGRMSDKILESIMFQYVSILIIYNIPLCGQ